MTSWTPIDNTECGELPSTPDLRPSYNSLFNYVGIDKQLRMTRRVMLAAAEMSSESHPFSHDTAACSEDDTVRRCAIGIYETPKANMYQACQDMNNTIMFSGTYNIVYVEGTVNNRVSMAWPHQNK